MLLTNSLKLTVIKSIFTISFLLGFYLPITFSQDTINYKEKYSHHPFSCEADYDHSPCIDTIKFLFWTQLEDMDMMLPTWQPMHDYNTITQLEGTIIKKPGNVHWGTHISPEDFPLFHYTHDFSFDVQPDSTPDNRYTSLLTVLCKEQKNGEEVIRDTTLKPFIHCEWESGIAANNEGNDCAELNQQGKSCGFFSQGHESGELFWNWPSTGDWVHVEGLLIWDRGHPPAGTEIHPARFLAVKRMNPHLMDFEGQVKVATKVDLFASGDGGAMVNNRTNVPEFVNKSPMNVKDYTFTVSTNVPKPSDNSKLKWKIVDQKGNTYTQPISVITNNDNGTAKIDVKWRGYSNDLICAKTIFLFWDEEADLTSYTKYKVTLNKIKFRRMKEFISRSEFRIFTEVNGNWMFLNELYAPEDPLNSQLGKTWKRNWKINRSFEILVPNDGWFRVHGGGFEADGIDRIFGHLVDHHAECNIPWKRYVHDKLTMMSPFKFRGCLDDLIGEVYQGHYVKDLKDLQKFKVFGNGRKIWDLCPCDSKNQRKKFRLDYTIEKMKL